jgi:hypothetical protein
MKATTAKNAAPRMLLIVVISAIVHGAVIGLLMVTGVLRADLLLDRTNAEAAESPAARQLKERVERERKDRQTRKLKREHAVRLKEETEQIKQKTIGDYVKEVRRKYAELKSLKQEKLSEVQQRTQEDVRNAALDELRTRAGILERETTNLGRRYKHPVRSTIASLAIEAWQAMDQFVEAADDRELGEALLDLATSTEAQATRAATEKDPDVNGKQRLGHPEDQQNHHLAVTFREAVERVLNPREMSSMNDTQSAKPFQDEAMRDPESLQSAGDQYEMALQLERDIAEHYTDFRAAELALTQNTSFDEAREKLADIQQPERPDLKSELESLQKQLAGGSEQPTVRDLNAYREALDRVTNQVEQIDRRAQGILQQASGLGGKGKAGLRALLARGALQAQGRSTNLAALMRALHGDSAGGSGSGTAGERGFHIEQEGGRDMRQVDPRRRIRISKAKVIAQAMTGRRFSRDSKRKGWLYLDAWYLIGPWENNGRVDYTNVHPPENGIDFDAIYAGKEGRELRWQYIHSNNIRVIPENGPGDSTWYAFTELYFEESMEMLLAVASDDATKVWINNQVVWQENGLSQWSPGEGVRKVFFKEGSNTMLVRVENGPGETIFSVVVCPPEAIANRN